MNRIINMIKINRKNFRFVLNIQILKTYFMLKAVENNWSAELKAFEQKVKSDCEDQEKIIHELKR